MGVGWGRMEGVESGGGGGREREKVRAYQRLGQGKEPSLTLGGETKMKGARNTTRQHAEPWGTPKREKMLRGSLLAIVLTARFVCVLSLSLSLSLSGHLRPTLYTHRTPPSPVPTVCESDFFFSSSFFALSLTVLYKISIDCCFLFQY